MRGHNYNDEFEDDEALLERGAGGDGSKAPRGWVARLNAEYGRWALPVCALLVVSLLLWAGSSAGEELEDDSDMLKHVLPPAAAAQTASWLREALQGSLARVAGRGPLGADGRLPAAVVEEHHHSLQYWYEAAKTGGLPARGVKLLHVDGLGDMAPPSCRPDGPRTFPAPLPASTHQWNVAAAFTNDEFVLAAVEAGLLDEVVVVQPHWVPDTLFEKAGETGSDGVHSETYDVGRVRGAPWLVCVCEGDTDMCDARARVGVGRREHAGTSTAGHKTDDEELRDILDDVDDADWADVDDEDDDDEDEGHRQLEIARSRCVSDARVRVWNVRMQADGSPPPGAARALAGFSRDATAPGGEAAAVILDVDANFFDMASPEERLLHAGLQHEEQGGLSWVISEVSCPKVGTPGAERREADAWLRLLGEAAGGKERATALYDRLMKGKEPLLEPLTLCHGMSHEEAGKLVGPLVKMLHRHLTKPAMRVLAELGPACAQGAHLDTFHLCLGLGAAHEHPSSGHEIAAAVEGVGALLRLVRAPSLVTFSRSVRDGNVRGAAAHVAERHLFDAVKGAFPSKPLEPVYDPRLLGGEKGWAADQAVVHAAGHAAASDGHHRGGKHHGTPAAAHAPAQ